MSDIAERIKKIVGEQLGVEDSKRERWQLRWNNIGTSAGRFTRRSTMFFRFPEDARWNPDKQAVEFGIGIGEYEGVVSIPRLVFRRFIDGSMTPERCLGAYHLQRTRFELVA